MFQWIPFMAYVITTAITPGPNNIMSLTNGSRLGFKKALPFNFGVWAGFSMVAIICTLLCTLLSAAIPKIEFPMLVIGAAYMLWLAFKTFKSSGKIEENSAGTGFVSGMLLQFINPKGYIYSIMSMEAYILPHYQKPLQLLAFALFLAFMGFVCTVCWSAFGTVFRVLFSKYSKIVNTIMALLLVYCAVSLFL